MASVPAIFRAVVLGLAAAILASYQTPLGPEQWAKRYATLLAESPLDDPAVIHLPPYPAAKGVYAPNVLLQSLTKLGEGLLIAPEDFELDPTNTFFYVSTADGWIKKLYLATGQVQNWTYVGGRPLGIALDHAGDVLVCEPIQHSLLKVRNMQIRRCISLELTHSLNCRLRNCLKFVRIFLRFVD